MSKRHLFLMGYRGSGKSAVADVLAKRLAWPVVDTDRIVEANAKKTIAAIFEQDGQEAFRELEEKAIRDVANKEAPHVISLGGGAILRQANQIAISTSGQVVWLQASPATLYQRISCDDQSAASRPKLTDRTGYEEVVSVLAERKPIYERLADFSLDTESLSPDQLAIEINDWLDSASY